MKALASRRYEHERTGEALPAYVINGYVVEKARRDWDGRSTGPGGRGLSPGPREWWEVRRQGSQTQAGVSIGRLLFQADTFRECKDWVVSNQESRSE